MYEKISKYLFSPFFIVLFLFLLCFGGYYYYTTFYGKSETSKKELENLNNQLIELSKLTESLLARNKEQENLLKNANESLMMQEKMFQQERKSLKRDRNTAILTAGVAVLVAAKK